MASKDASSSSSISSSKNPQIEIETLIPNLPNDISIQIISRIPKSNYPHLSLISHQWHSILQSPLLYASRRALRTTESSLFIILRIFNPKDSTFSFNWYFLDPSRFFNFNSEIAPDPLHISLFYPCPDRPIGELCAGLGQFEGVIGGSICDGKFSSVNDGNAPGPVRISPIYPCPDRPIGELCAGLGQFEGVIGRSICGGKVSNVNDGNAPAPVCIFAICPCPDRPIGAAYVNLGQFVYVIGGSVRDIPSNNVWVYDCLRNNWELGSKMRVGREFCAAGVIDEKIYVLGGCLGDNWVRSMNWAEVYDPKTRVWGPVESPVEVREKWMHGCAVVGGRIFGMADRGGVVFEPKTGVWGPVSMELDLGWRGRAAVVDEVLYCYDYLGKVRGFDVGENVWKELKGVNDSKGCLPRFLCGATMANVGGKLFVVWEGKDGSRNGKGKGIEVWCAEIVVRKDGSGELWGSVVWSSVVIDIPKGSSIVHCLGVDV